MQQSTADSGKVSVVVPTKDRRALLMETLDSVRAQTYGNWEVIVVDDGSTDGTIEQMTRIAAREPKVRFIRRDNGLPGGSASRNLGFAEASGEFVLFLDSDDLLAPHCLQQRVPAMQAQPQLDFAVAPARLFYHRPGDREMMWNADLPEDDLDRLLRVDPPWGTLSAIWRRSSLQRLPGPWDELALSWQDWEFHIRALAEGLRYERLPEPDCYVRTEDPSRESIGRRAFSPEHIQARKALLERIYTFLAERNLLNQQRREYFAGLYFHNAEIVADAASRQEALRFWRACRHLELLPSSGYFELLLYLQLWHVQQFRWHYRRVLNWRWPRVLIVGRSTTHHRTPAPDAGTAA